MPETEIKSATVTARDQEAIDTTHNEERSTHDNEEQNSLIECANSKNSDDEIKIDVEDAVNHQKPGKFR